MQKLWDNVIKRKTARKYCKKRGLVYKMFDIKRNRLTIKDIVDLHSNGIIELTDKYKKVVSDLQKDDKV